MTNRERFLAGHPFELHGHTVVFRTLYSTAWLMVDNIQRYAVCLIGQFSCIYEIMFTPFDSIEPLLFSELKFINDEN